MSNVHPTVSVVTPSFNGGRYVSRTIQSVLDQDCPEIEYLVMDGGSTDQTREVLAQFANQSGGRVTWVCEPDHGQADAINKGFARTRGDILAWLNCDDTYVAGAVRAAAEYLAAHPEVALVYGDANFIDAHGDLIGPCVHVEPFNRGRLFRYSDIIVQPAAFFPPLGVRSRRRARFLPELDARLGPVAAPGRAISGRLSAARAGELSLARRQQDCQRRLAPTSGNRRGLPPTRQQSPGVCPSRADQRPSSGCAQSLCATARLVRPPRPPPAPPAICWFLRVPWAAC